VEVWLAESPRWLWLLLPLAGLLLPAALVLPTLRRPSAELRRRAASALLAAAGLATFAAFAFAFLNLTAAIEPSRKLANIGFWFLGTVLGAAATLPLSPRLARRRG